MTIIYSPIPHEFIFADYFNYKNQEEHMVMYEGIPIVVEPIGHTKYKVKQILSTDPEHYLNDKCYPGAVLSLF